MRIDGSLQIDGATATLNSLIAQATVSAGYIFQGVYSIPEVSGLIGQSDTGFPVTQMSNVTVTINASTHVCTLSAITGTTFNYYIAGKSYSTATAVVTLTPISTGLWYIYFDSANTLTASKTSWDFTSGSVACATSYWDGTSHWIQKEFHGLQMDQATRGYLHDTMGTRFKSGFGIQYGTLNTNGQALTITIGSGVIADEDIYFSISQKVTGASVSIPVYSLTNTTASPVWSRAISIVSGAVTATVQSYFRLNSAGTTHLVTYNLATGGNWTQVEASNNNFVAYWIYAINDYDTPIISLQGQRVDTTLGNAQANNTPDSLTLTSNLPTAEMKLLYRIILQTAGAFTESGKARIADVVDYRTVSSAPAQAYVATSHGALTGLANDDHLQYALLARRSTDETLRIANIVSDTLSITQTATINYLSVIGSNLQFPLTGSIIGTTNQINVSSNQNSVSFTITLSLPQSIAINSPVQFGSLVLATLSVTQTATINYLYANSSNLLSSPLTVNTVYIGTLSVTTTGCIFYARITDELVNSSTIGNLTVTTTATINALAINSPATTEDAVKIQVDSLNSGTGIRIVSNSVGGGDLVLLQTTNSFGGDILALNQGSTLTGRALYIAGGGSGSNAVVRIEGGTNRTGAVLQVNGVGESLAIDAIKGIRTDAGLLAPTLSISVTATINYLNVITQIDAPKRGLLLPQSNSSVTGLVTTFTVSATMSFGQVGYMTSVGSIDMASASTTVSMPVIAMCADSVINQNVVGNFLLNGIARYDSWSWTIGIPIYTSTVTLTQGLTQTAPSTIGNVVQILGVAKSATTILFNPNLVTVEKA